jgi:peptidoglycan/LPS O-acetylase OafA/YrhL
MRAGAGIAVDTPPAAHFPCFDGLRAVAALSVFMFHFVGLAHPPWLHGYVEALVARLGGQGVGFFFVISGFLLYRPFVDAAFRGAPSPALGPFWLRRFVRIFPAYWIALTAFVYFFGFFSIHGLANFVTYYGLLQNYRAGYALFGLGIAWTLVIEVSFYLALPLINQIARAAAGKRAPADTVYRVQIGLLVALGAIGLAVRALNIWVLKTTRPGAWFPLHASGYSLLAYLDWFAIGMAFAVLSVSSSNGRRPPRVVTQLARHPWTSWVIAVGVFALQARLFETLPTSRPNRLVLFFLPSLIGITALFIVLPAVFGDQDQSLIRRFLRTKPMVYLGVISYGIYLWHFIFVTQSGLWVANGTLPDVFVLRFVVVFTLTIAVASASYYVIERPLISWSHRISRRRPTPEPPNGDPALVEVAGLEMVRETDR